MKLTRTPDQTTLLEQAQRLFRPLRLSSVPTDGERPLVDCGPAWTALGPDGFDLFGVHVPEHLGGFGQGLSTLAVVAEEAGASLACPRLLTSVTMATTALVVTGDSGNILPSLMSGDRVATTVGLDDPHSEALLLAHHHADGWTVDGAVSHVLDVDADLAVVAATREGTSRVALFAIDLHDVRAKSIGEPALDLTRPLGRLVLDQVPAVLLPTDDAAAAIANVRHAGMVVLAAESVGGMRSTVELAVEHARQRHQFGRPIGSFQAVKHRCADMHITLELARSAGRWAAWCADHDPAQLPLAAALAHVTVSQAYQEIAKAAVQVLGGIGFTWEHPVHLYLKRAKAASLLFGGVAHQRDAVARLVDL